MDEYDEAALQGQAAEIWGGLRERLGTREGERRTSRASTWSRRSRSRPRTRSTATSSSSARRLAELGGFSRRRAPARSRAGRTAAGPRAPRRRRRASPAGRARTRSGSRRRPSPSRRASSATTPVTPTASPNSRACWTPFCPVVASTTSSVSCGAPSRRPAMTRRTFASSSIRFVCVWRRPAVSTTTTSRPRATAASTASYATAAGSAPRSEPTKSAPARSAQISSCSSAAARYVSAAATTTERPCSASLAESLPIVVVLPGPVDADDEDHGRLVRDVEDRRLAEELGHLLGERRVEIRELAARLEPPHELGGGADADVAGDERLLEPLPVRVVAGIERGRRHDLAGERAARLRERVAQPREEAAALLLAARAPRPARPAAAPSYASFQRKRDLRSRLRGNELRAAGERGLRPAPCCLTWVAWSSKARSCARARRKPARARSGLRLSPAAPCLSLRPLALLWSKRSNPLRVKAAA